MSPAVESRRIRLGISTCPNDTFAFAALMDRRVDWRGLEFAVELHDIEVLNKMLPAGLLDVAKVSFHAALWMAASHVVLPSGAALGFGVGPLLLAADPDSRPQPGSEEFSRTTFCPGRWTTASLLFELFYPKSTRVQQVVFSEILPGLQSRQADFGVCIHEGRFTYARYGLSLVEDLGSRWEHEAGAALPLGGILASRHLPSEVRSCVNSVIRDSLEMALGDPDSALPAMRRYAQEFNDDVLWQHVKLYVNEWTRDLGDAGRASLKKMHELAGNAGYLPETWQPLTVHV